MANRKDFYFRQRVLEGEMDAAFDDTENADRALAQDIGATQIADGSGIPIANINVVPDDFDAIRGGIHSGYLISFTDGLPPSGGNPQPLVDVHVSAGVAVDWQGRRITTPDNFIVDITAEGDTPVGEGGSTTGGAVVTPPAGQTRIVTLMVLFDRTLTDERVDGNAATVFYNQAEAFVFRAKAGNSSVSTPVPPQGDADAVILVDLRVDENNMIIGWSFSRRGDWIRTSTGTTGDPATTAALQTGSLDNTGTDFIAANSRQAILRLLRAYAGTVTDISAHVNNVTPAQTHTAANIDFKLPAANWLDATSLIARAPGGGNTDGVQGAIREIIEDLAATAANADGGGRIGAMAQIAGPGAYAGNARYATSAGAVRAQIKTLLNAVEQQVIELTVGDGTNTFGNYNTSDFAGDWGATLQAAITSVPSGTAVRVFILGTGTLTASTGVTPGNRDVFLHARSRATVISATFNGIFFNTTGVGHVTHMENLKIQNLSFPAQPSVKYAGTFSARNCNFYNGVDAGLPLTIRRGHFENCTLEGSTYILRGAIHNTVFNNCDFFLLGTNNNDALWDGSDDVNAYLLNVGFYQCRFNPRIFASAAFFTYFRFADYDENIAFVDCTFADANSATNAAATEIAFAGTPPKNISFVRSKIQTRNGLFDCRGGTDIAIADCDITLAGTNSTVFLLAANKTAENIVIQNNRVQQTNFTGTKHLYYGLTGSTLKNSTIKDNRCYDLDVLFEFVKVERVTIKDNLVASTTTGRIKNFIKPFGTWSFFDFRIEKNTFRGLGFNSTNQRAIDLTTATYDTFTGSKNLYIVGNTFENIGTAAGGGSTDNAAAIEITLDPGSASNIVVRDNVIQTVNSNDDTLAISITGAEHVTVTGNIIRDIGSDPDCAAVSLLGIYMSSVAHVVCKDNLIDRIGHPSSTIVFALILSDGSSQAAGVVVSDNKISGLNGTLPFGIIVDDGFAQAVVNNNTVTLDGIVGTCIQMNDISGVSPFTRNNTINNNTLNGGDTGISLIVGHASAPEDTYGRFTINGNIATDFNATGIEVDGTAGLRENGFVISGNTVYSATTAANLKGINVTDINYAIIAGNSVNFPAITGASHIGINLAGTGHNHNIHGNQVYVRSNHGSPTATARGIFVASTMWYVLVGGNHVDTTFCLGAHAVELNEGIVSGLATHWAAGNMVQSGGSNAPYGIDFKTSGYSVSPMPRGSEIPGSSPVSLGAIDLNYRRQ